MIEIHAKESPLYVASRIIEIPSDERAAEALQKDAVARRVLAKNVELRDGDRAGSRLNLNVLKSTGVAVNTIHAPTNKDGYRENRGGWAGKAMSYRPVVQLRDCYLNCHQVERERIATGSASKSPMASADGNLDLVSPVRTDGIELRFNPKRERLFVDANNHPVQWVEHATVVGHRVYARGLIRYYEFEEEAPKKEGSAPCRVVFPGEGQMQITMFK